MTEEPTAKDGQNNSKLFGIETLAVSFDECYLSSRAQNCGNSDYKRITLIGALKKPT